MSFQRFLQLVERLGTLAATDAIEEVATSTRGRRTEIAAKTSDGTMVLSACILTRPLPVPTARQLALPTVGLHAAPPEATPVLPRHEGTPLSFAGLGLVEATAGAWATAAWPRARWEAVTPQAWRAVVTREGVEALRAAQPADALPTLHTAPVALRAGHQVAIECWGGESPEVGDLVGDLARRLFGGLPRVNDRRGEPSVTLPACADEALLATAISYLVAGHVPFALRDRAPRKARGGVK